VSELNEGGHEAHLRPNTLSDFSAFLFSLLSSALFKEGLLNMTRKSTMSKVEPLKSTMCSVAPLPPNFNVEFTAAGLDFS
jgi:hypothetical protein